MAGDVDEVDILNHYVGMRAFSPDDVPERLFAGVLGAWTVGPLLAARTAITRRDI